MPFDPEKNDESQWFTFLLKALQDERFLHKQAVANNVPFFVYPYPVAFSTIMERTIRNLVKQLRQQGRTVVHVNLYDLAVELLQARGIWEQVLEVEPSLPKDELMELLQGVLDPETHLVPAIRQRITATGHPDMLLLSGAGEVFPYLRSHTVLNSLEKAVGDVPTLLFFPGKYVQSLDVGASLDLFDVFHEDRYYRAFNICNFA